MSVLRHVLGFAAGGATMLALDATSRRHSGRANPLAAVLARVRPPPVADDTLEARVRLKISQAAIDPTSITVAIDHGCVDLRGPIATRERARLIKSIAAIPGVDAIQDLLTEPPAHSPALAPALSPARALSPALFVLATGAALGLVLAALTLPRRPRRRRALRFW